MTQQSNDISRRARRIHRRKLDILKVAARLFAERGYEGNATALRPYEDDLILVNLSLWASFSDLSTFVYKSRHRQVMQHRRQWFERFDGPYLALWWVPSGHIPSVEEAKERLAYLRAHGETPYAFSFKEPFPR